MSNRLKDISHGIASQESAGMHRLAKMLLEQPFNRARMKMQALRYLITPQQLARRQVHKYGWLSVVPIHWLNHEQRTALAQEIRSIEADPALPPYERVGWIVRAIKEATGKRFLTDSAFRTMMNTKYNEYVLAEHLDDIHSVEDALRILREADVTAKTTTMLGAQPEMFHDNRLMGLNRDQANSAVMLGGQSHQSGMRDMADYVHELHILRHTHFPRIGKSADRDALMTKIVDAMRKVARQNEVVRRVGKTCLSYLRSHMPERVTHVKDTLGLDPSLGSFAGCTSDADATKLLRETFKNRLDEAGNRRDLCGFFNSPHALHAVVHTLTHSKITGPDGRIDLGAQRAYEDWVLRQIDFDRLRSTLANDPLLEVIKKLRVDNASSYDTLVVNMARYPNEQRQPMVYATDRLLAIDSTKDNAAWRREAAIILKGASQSLFPSNLALLAPNEVLRSETREAVHRSIGGDPNPEVQAKTWVLPGGEAGFFTPSGMPTIVGLPVGVEDAGRSSMENDASFALNAGGKTPALRNREALLQFTEQQYNHYKQRCTPVTILTGAAKPAQKKKGHIKDKPTLRLAKFAMIDMALLATGETGSPTPAHQFVEYAVNRDDDYKVDNLTVKIKDQVGMMNFSRETLNTPDAFGNTALHEAMRQSMRGMGSDRADDLVTAYASAGASYAAKNFYGVPLAEVLPLARGSKGFLERHMERQRHARADVMGENLMSAMGGSDEPTPEEEPAASDTRFAL